MAARVKKRADTSTNRESDKIIIRLPEGMRDALAKLAARNGRSMTAEVAIALATYFAHERQSAAVRAQLQAPGPEIGGSTATIKDELSELRVRLARLEARIIQADAEFENERQSAAAAVSAQIQAAGQKIK
jgi:hypothetical protein